MQDFRAMRREARAIRDDAIAAARTVYEQRINEINALQSSINGRPRRALPGMLTKVLPNEPFTLDELNAILTAKYPTTRWTRENNQVTLRRLEKSGVIKRLNRPGWGKPVRYLRVAAPRQKLSDAVAALLTKPMTVTAICVTLLEAGYKTRITRKNRLRVVVFQMLRSEPERFRRTGWKWEMSFCRH